MLAATEQKCYACWCPVVKHCARYLIWLPGVQVIEENLVLTDHNKKPEDAQKHVTAVQVELGDQRSRCLAGPGRR